MEDGKIIIWEDDPNAPKTPKPEDLFMPNNPLERPKINYIKPLVAFLIYAALFTGVLFIPFKRMWLTVLVLTVYSIIYFALIAKRTAIWLVHLYQNKASDETRLMCAMEPSCSVYMIMAIEKYGLIRGVYKGVRRMFRCGDVRGVDYP